MNRRKGKKRPPRCKMPSVEVPRDRCNHHLPCPHHGLGSICGAGDDPCDEMEEYFAPEDMRRARRNQGDRP